MDRLFRSSLTLLRYSSFNQTRLQTHQLPSLAQTRRWASPSTKDNDEEDLPIRLKRLPKPIQPQFAESIFFSQHRPLLCESGHAAVRSVWAEDEKKKRTEKARKRKDDEDPTNLRFQIARAPQTAWNPRKKKVPSSPPVTVQANQIGEDPSVDEEDEQMIYPKPAFQFRINLDEAFKLPNILERTRPPKQIWAHTERFARKRRRNPQYGRFRRQFKYTEGQIWDYYHFLSKPQVLAFSSRTRRKSSKRRKPGNRRKNFIENIAMKQ